MIPDHTIDRSATLLWFPSGQTPTDADFEPRDTDPRAEKFWWRHEAVLEVVRRAVNDTRPEGCDPWIKYGDIVLDEHGIKLQYRRLIGGD